VVSLWGHGSGDFLRIGRRADDLLSSAGTGKSHCSRQVHQIFLYWIFLFGNHTVRHRRTADAALSYEKGWVKDIGKYCGLNDGSSALQICAGGDWTFHVAVWLSSAKELSGKLYVAFLSGTSVKYSAGDFPFNRDVRAKAVSQYCDRSRAVLRTVSPAETLGGTNRKTLRICGKIPGDRAVFCRT